MTESTLLALPAARHRHLLRQMLAAGPVLGLTVGLAVPAQASPRIPKEMSSSSSSSMIALGSADFPLEDDTPPPMAPPPRPEAPAPQGGDPWAGMLFNAPDPWTPGAAPRGPRPRPVTTISGVPGVPGSGSAARRAIAAAPRGPVAPLGADEKPGPERTQELYREALVHWANGDSDLASRELSALETRVVRDTELASSKRLLKAEEKVIDDVASGDLEVLVPIARLHFEVYRRYLNEGARGHALVEVHSRTMVHDLAMLYRQQSAGKDAALVASHLLTSLGELLQHGAQHQAAAELYTQAAELDPHNAVPALSLGIIYEKFEQYKSAVAWLRKALAIEPQNAEARLRLGVNLERLGKVEEARKLLEGLTAETNDSWVVALAFEEMAQLDARREAPAAAEKVLRAGLARFPQSVRMRVQLAAALDRQGKIREGRQVIEEIPAMKPNAVQEGARFRYNTSSSDTVAVSRGFFEDNAASRMHSLAEALDRGPGQADEAAAQTPAAEQRP
jgi:tetratricopeptide (TPR) repeat protein